MEGNWTQKEDKQVSISATIAFVSRRCGRISSSTPIVRGHGGDLEAGLPGLRLEQTQPEKGMSFPSGSDSGKR